MKLSRSFTIIRNYWMKLAAALGWCNTHLLLAMIFYGLITPIGWCCRLLGKDPLRKKPLSQRISYWEPKAPLDHKKSMKYQF